MIYNDPNQALLIVTYFHPYNFEEMHEYVSSYSPSTIRSDFTEFENFLQFLTTRGDIEIIGYNQAIDLARSGIQFNNWNRTQVAQQPQIHDITPINIYF